MRNTLTAPPGFRARALFAGKALAAFSFLIVHFMPPAAQAKTPGSTYCFYKTCHRVKTIVETQRLIGREHTLPASFYDDCKSDRYNPCGLTSSGEVFRPNAADNAASPIYPDGTKLLVWSPQTGQAIVLRINNAGPYWGNRTLDVSRAAADTLGFRARGVANLKARVLEAPSKAEATYRKGRKYAPVEGHIGQYQSASAAAAALTSVQTFAAATLAPFNGKSLPAVLAGDETLPASMMSVAYLAPSKRKLPADVVADAKSLVTFTWPVVRGPAMDAKPAEVAAADQTQADLVQVARLEDTAQRGVTWSQQVAKSKIRRAALEAKSDDARDQRARVRLASVEKATALKQSAKRKSRDADLRTAPDARKQAVPANLALKAGSTGTPAKIMTAKAAQKRFDERDAPNDNSIFSRHNPQAPGGTFKEALTKSGPSKAGLIRQSSVKAGAMKTSAAKPASTKRLSFSTKGRMKGSIQTALAEDAFYGAIPLPPLTGQAPRLPSQYVPATNKGTRPASPPVPVTHALA